MLKQILAIQAEVNTAARAASQIPQEPLNKLGISLINDEELARITAQSHHTYPHVLRKDLLATDHSRPLEIGRVGAVSE